MVEILDEHSLRNRYHVFEDCYHARARKQVIRDFFF